MGVRAIFELPVPIWVMSETLDATYSTGYGNLRFNVVMPHGLPPVGGAPAVLDVESLPLIGEQVVWVMEYGAHIPQSLRPATALHRVALTDVEGPSYDHMPWFTPEHQLAEYIGGWFNEVRTWAEIVTGQDLDPNHRVYDAESVGAGLTFIEPSNDDALGRHLASFRSARRNGLPSSGSSVTARNRRSRRCSPVTREPRSDATPTDAQSSMQPLHLRSSSSGMSIATSTNFPTASENALRNGQRHSAFTSQSSKTPAFSWLFRSIGCVGWPNFATTPPIGVRHQAIWTPTKRCEW